MVAPEPRTAQKNARVDRLRGSMKFILGKGLLCLVMSLISCSSNFSHEDIILKANGHSPQWESEKDSTSVVIALALTLAIYMGSSSRRRPSPPSRNGSDGDFID